MSDQINNLDIFVLPADSEEKIVLRTEVHELRAHLTDMIQPAPNDEEHISEKEEWCTSWNDLKDKLITRLTLTRDMTVVINFLVTTSAFKNAVAKQVELTLKQTVTTTTAIEHEPISGETEASNQEQETERSVEEETWEIDESQDDKAREQPPIESLGPAAQESEPKPTPHMSTKMDLNPVPCVRCRDLPRPCRCSTKGILCYGCYKAKTKCSLTLNLETDKGKQKTTPPPPPPPPPPVSKPKQKPKPVATTTCAVRASSKATQVPGPTTGTKKNKTSDLPTATPAPPWLTSSKWKVTAIEEEVSESEDNDEDTYLASRVSGLTNILQMIEMACTTMRKEVEEIDGIMPSQVGRDFSVRQGLHPFNRAFLMRRLSQDHTYDRSSSDIVGRLPKMFIWDGQDYIENALNEDQNAAYMTMKGVSQWCAAPNGDRQGIRDSNRDRQAWGKGCCVVSSQRALNEDWWGNPVPRASSCLTGMLTNPKEGYPNVADTDVVREDIVIALFSDNLVKKAHRKDIGPEAPAVIEDQEKVTPQMLRRATNTVKMSSQSIKWFPLEVEKVQEYCGDCCGKAKGITKEKLVSEISNAKEPSGSAKSQGWVCVSKVKNVSLSVAGDVDLIWPVYVQLYCTIPTELDALAIDLEDKTKDTLWEGSNNLGVNNFLLLYDVALNRLLSVSQKSAWNDSAEKEFVEGNPDMQPLSLLWHQHIAIALIVKKIWQTLAHEFWNPNAGWYAMLLLMRGSHVWLITTVTPLFTSPKSVYEEPSSKTWVWKLTTIWIRKIKYSLWFDSRRINDSLPPYIIMVIFLVHLPDPEHQIAQSGMDSLAGRGKLNLDDVGAFSQMGSLLWSLGGADTDDHFTDILYGGPDTDHDEYDEVQLTKEKLDNEYDEDLDPDFISLHAINNDLPQLMTMGTQKILVFAEFLMMGPLLISCTHACVLDSEVAQHQCPYTAGIFPFFFTKHPKNID
ncbi:uncharacterized protein HD556DRAFT_1312644 [Suillus plorans]|uniref:Uncharacterized protein n=1 Tax=Suillus plorans TaxID=116603 RepID=A0A9P7DCS8_9AGAM|nr:uncharacterized protein HD556DRAFT_1312644 [Suillus plorans]KAG1787609.1 hypothetical protein HD556DRAFT_1312644 [Suillus plorans]